MVLGMIVWDGSIVFVKMFDYWDVFFLSYLKLCRVLEFGVGCGLVGIYFCLFGVKMIVFIDMYCCIKIFKDNMILNVIGSCCDRIKVMEYIWGKSIIELIKDGLFDLIVVVEVFYLLIDFVFLV